MILAISGNRSKPTASRETGHQRYTLTRYPFLAGEDAFVIIRHQWAPKRLWGGQLYFEMSSNLGAQSRSLADPFNNAIVRALLLQRELTHVGDPATEEVCAAGQVPHVTVVDLL